MWQRMTVSYLYLASMVTNCLTIVQAPDDYRITFLDPENQQRDTLAQCITSKSTTGTCVPYTYCNDEDQKVPIGGDIKVSELRSYSSFESDCGLNNRCCTPSNVIEPLVISTTRTDSCLAPKSDIIPWAVSLYRVTEVQQARENLFCIGALIGSKVILTAATCVVSSQGYALYAKLPNSDKPKINYKILHRNIHPQYNSGSHDFDFGLLVLEDEVVWEDKKTQGACIANSELKGNCMSLGFDDRGELTSTKLNIEPGACNSFGNNATKDQACGTNDDEVCIVTIGAPVLCEVEDERQLLLGVARSDCLGNQTLLGSISGASEWITKKLNEMSVPKDVYTQNE